MSCARHFEGHAQFHKRTPLKASPQSNSLSVFSLFVSPPESPPLILNCLAFLPSHSVAFIMLTPSWLLSPPPHFFFTSSDGIEDAHRPYFQLPLMRDWFLEMSSIRGGLYSVPTLKKTKAIVNIIWGEKKSLAFFRLMH